MKYLIITYDDYFNIPYIKYYEEHLRESGHIYDIVLWNRSGQDTCCFPNAFVFLGQNRPSKFGKIIPFLQWRQFVIRLLRKRRYDRLIVLTTIPAVLLSDILMRDYSKRYWLDIRDYTYEYIPPYKAVVNTLVKHSAVTSISSKAFREFLPDGFPAVLVHNITNSTASKPHCTLGTEPRPITIGFVGGIQYAKENQQFIRLFQNNPKYRLKYVGKPHPGCDFEPFCRENGVTNVQFFPAFQNDEKPRIYESVDLINCIYGSQTKVVQLALPNKLYDCILYKKPMIVSKGTYLAQIVQQYHLGFAVDLEKDPVVKMTDEYLKGFDPIAFEVGCEIFLKIVLQEQTKFEEALKDFCRESMQHISASQTSYAQSSP